MKKIILLAILIVSILVSGCIQSQSSQPPTGNQANTITIKNNAFNPSTLTVKVGTTVTWTNEDSVTHTVTSDIGNELESRPLSNGQSYSHTFNTTGTFDYHCSVHPSMKASIIVE